MMANLSDPWPTEIRVNGDRRRLTVAFDGGDAYELTAEMLRVLSPSAEVQGHGPGQRVIVGGKSAVKIAAVKPVGNYAIRIEFDDGHDTGIYTWRYLEELGVEREARWSDYLADLERTGQSRDA